MNFEDILIFSFASNFGTGKVNNKANSKANKTPSTTTNQRNQVNLPQSYSQQIDYQNRLANNKQSIEI